MALPTSSIVMIDAPVITLNNSRSLRYLDETTEGDMPRPALVVVHGFALLLLLWTQPLGAADSCSLPPDATCPAACGSCIPEPVSCTFRTACAASPACPAGTVAVERSAAGCRLGQTQLTCENSGIRQTSTCATCQDGRYGFTCSGVCPGGQASPCSGHGVCDDGTTGDGTCTCDSGFTGSFCQYATPTLGVPPFSAEAANCQRIIGTATRRLADRLYGAHAACLDAEAAGMECVTASRDRQMSSAIASAQKALDARCTADSYGELGFTGTPAPAVRDALTDGTVQSIEDLLRKTYPGSYVNRP